jgi:hypothetical protein
MPDRPPRWSDETTTDPAVADRRNFYKVETWTAHDHIVRLLYAGSSLDRAREEFTAEITRWPAVRITVRQRARVLDRWPED